MNNITQTVIDVLKSEIVVEPDFTLADSALEAIADTGNVVTISDFVESVLDNMFMQTDNDDVDPAAASLAVTLIDAALREVDWAAVTKAIEKPIVYRYLPDYDMPDEDLKVFDNSQEADHGDYDQTDPGPLD